MFLYIQNRLKMKQLKIPIIGLKMSVKNDISVILKPKRDCMKNERLKICDCMRKLGFEVHDCMKKVRFEVRLHEYCAIQSTIIQIVLQITSGHNCSHLWVNFWFYFDVFIFGLYFTWLKNQNVKPKKSTFGRPVKVFQPFIKISFV